MSLIPFNQNDKALAPRDPFMNMLDSFFSDPLSLTRDLFSDTFKIDVKETEKEYTVEADLPGVDKKEVNLRMQDGVLTISVSRSEQKEGKDGDYIHQERRYASMQRSVRLTDASDNDVKASLKDGVLRIKVQKEPKNRDAKRIEIQ